MASSTSKHISKIKHTIIETAPKATLLMLLAGLFILFLTSLFIQRLESPVAFSAPFAYFALYLGTAMGGCFCAWRLEGRIALMCAFLSSSILCLLLIVAKAFIASPAATASFLISFITHLLVPAFAMIGELIGNRIKSNTKMKKRKNHYRSKK